MKMRPEIIATAHTHPFYASVFSACALPLPTVVARSGIQPHLPPRFEETSELIRRPEQGRALAETLGDNSAVLLRNHGVVTCGRTIPEPVLVGIALEKMCHEVLVVGAAGFEWSWPDKQEMARKHKTGEGIIDRAAIWTYYRRKLARAEAMGDPLLGTEPVPIGGN
jgi:L-fuculose-phosphate aldolase